MPILLVLLALHGGDIQRVGRLRVWGKVNVVHPIAGEDAAIPESGELLAVALGLLAAVLGPLDPGVLAQHAGLDKRPDIHPHAVVEVRFPADRLIVERLPGDEDVVGLLAFKNQLEPALEVFGSQTAGLGATLAALFRRLLPRSPISTPGRASFSLNSSSVSASATSLASL